MTAALDNRTTEKLVKVLNLFGSDHAGERDAALIRATAVLRSSGLDWAALVRLAAAPPPAAAAPQMPREAPHVVTARWALSFRDQLRGRERSFLTNVLRCKALTPKQETWLSVIVDELRRGGAS